MRFLELPRLGLELARLMRSQWWSSKAIARYQEVALTRVLDNAVAKVPYYSHAASEGPTGTALERLQQFAPLSRAEVQANADQFINRDLAAESLYSSHSSGSTGEPLRTFFDRDTWLKCRYATKARRILNVSKRLAQRIAIISERADDSSAALRSLSYSGRLFRPEYFFVDDDIDDNIARLSAFKPTQLYGFPAYAALLSERMAERGQMAPNIPVIFTSSETVTEPLRTALETSYRGKVYDVYGSTEFKEIAYQCEHGRYHVNFESVFVESESDPETGIPRLLITSLTNVAMPLIRYEIGDFGRVEQGRCECGREGPYLTDLLGRCAQTLVFSDGSAIAPYPLYSAIDSHRNVQSFEIVHRGEDEVLARIFAQPRLNEIDLNSFRENLTRILPSVARVTVEALEQRIPESRKVSIRSAPVDSGLN